MEEIGEQVTRRNFVGAALLGTAGIAAASILGGCSPQKPGEAASSQEWDETADVVVIGSGAGGHAAALEAVNAGASAIILEKAEKTGGDSSLCDGILGGWGTRLAKAQGVNLSADDVYAWFMGHPEWHGPLDPDVARVNADKCGETIDWLQDQGVPFQEKVGPKQSYTNLPAIHQVDGKGAAMMKVLEENAEKAGVKTILKTRATNLVVDESGRVIGVSATQGKKGFRVKANKGVVLASGAHTANQPLMVALNPENKSLQPSSNPNSTGDGLAMASELGIQTCRTSYFPLLNNMAGRDTKTPGLLDYTERLQGVLLGADGGRFCNEAMDYLSFDVPKAVLRKQNAQDGKEVVVLIGTTPTLDQLQSKRPLQWAKSDTVEDVASQIGLDPAQVKSTVDRYNGFCASGSDADFGRPAENLVPLTGPFYAAHVTVTSSIPVGGIKINADAQAVKIKNPIEEDTPTETVPGLFATGVVCEWNCAAGWTVLSAMTMGRIAGQNAAQ